VKSLQSKANTVIHMDIEGSIRMSTALGNLFIIDAKEDSILQKSVQSYHLTDACSSVIGVVKRNLYEIMHETVDALKDVYTFLHADFEYYTDIVGKNAEHKRIAKADGMFDISLNEDGTVKNPALTEVRHVIYETADYNIGTSIMQSKNDIVIGKMHPNVIAEFYIGTNVNRLGKIVGFDYNFGRDSKDGYLYENWLTKNYQFNRAGLLGLTLHTRGVDKTQQGETADWRGSLWEFQVDKEGLTKWNIPAATDIAGREPYRAGRSLLFNADGSITVSLGKEVTENNPPLTEISKSSYGRKDRSLSLDMEGNVEVKVGKDSIAGQSIILKADGSIEAVIGKNTDNERSIELTMDGGIYINVKGADKNDKAIVLNTVGDVEFNIDGNVVENITGTKIVNSDSVSNHVRGSQQNVYPNNKAEVIGGSKETVILDKKSVVIVNGYSITITKQGLSINCLTGNITLQTLVGNIQLTSAGGSIDLKSTLPINISSTSPVNISSATMVNINNGVPGKDNVLTTMTPCFFTGSPVHFPSTKRCVVGL